MKNELEASAEVVEEVKTTVKKTKKKTEPEPVMPLWKYFRDCAPETHKYKRAYIERAYRGKMYTMKEWEKELNGKL